MKTLAMNTCRKQEQKHNENEEILNRQVGVMSPSFLSAWIHDSKKIHNPNLNNA